MTDPEKEAVIEEMANGIEKAEQAAAHHAYTPSPHDLAWALLGVLLAAGYEIRKSK